MASNRKVVPTGRQRLASADINVGPRHTKTLGCTMRPMLLDLDDTLVDDHFATAVAFEADDKRHTPR